MKRIILYLGMILLTLSGCAGFHDLTIYQSVAPYEGEPEVDFGSPEGNLTGLIFQMRYVKDYVHSGLPNADEMQNIKKEGARLGARILILDCPPAGAEASGMCLVYGGYKGK